MISFREDLLENPYGLSILGSSPRDITRHTVLGIGVRKLDPRSSADCREDGYMERHKAYHSYFGVRKTRYTSQYMGRMPHGTEEYIGNVRSEPVHRQSPNSRF